MRPLNGEQWLKNNLVIQSLPRGTVPSSGGSTCTNIPGGKGRRRCTLAENEENFSGNAASALLAFPQVKADHFAVASKNNESQKQESSENNACGTWQIVHRMSGSGMQQAVHSLAFRIMRLFQPMLHLDTSSLKFYPCDLLFSEDLFDDPVAISHLTHLLDSISIGQSNNNSTDLSDLS
ncbi:hypothetical protein Fot_02665 [Forsythia ovata]|uniref:Uncharacterized protein n=1 Tax=Forsythia ovata TaxID=205694 RepID=A0ABD1X7H0_9LAMI